MQRPSKANLAQTNPRQLAAKRIPLQETGGQVGSVATVDKAEVEAWVAAWVEVEDVVAHRAGVENDGFACHHPRTPAYAGVTSNVAGLLPERHSRESGNPENHACGRFWTPAYAGVTGNVAGLVYP